MNRHRLTGRRIAALTLEPILDGELAEPLDRKLFALGGRVGNLVGDRGNRRRAIVSARG
jgi:hypothetical protein